MQQHLPLKGNKLVHVTHQLRWRTQPMRFWASPPVPQMLRSRRSLFLLVFLPCSFFSPNQLFFWCVCFFSGAPPLPLIFFEGIGCFRWHVGCFSGNSCVERLTASLPCNAIQIKVAIRKIFRRWEHAAHQTFGDVFRWCLFDWPGCWYMNIYDDMGHLPDMLGKLWGQAVGEASRVFVSTFSSLWEVSWQEYIVCSDLAGADKRLWKDHGAAPWKWW